MSEWAPHVRAQLARLQLDGSRELEIVEELSQHLDERFEDLRREGFDETRARQLAVAELVEPTALAAQMTPLRQAAHAPSPLAGAPSGSRLGDHWQDLRYAARMLRKNPLIAATAVLTIALGIGANSAIFALVDATLLRPLPFPDPSQLVLTWERTPTTSRGLVAALNMLDWASRSRSFVAIGGFGPNVGGMVMSNPGGLPENVARQWVTSDIFTALGVTPLAGRVFLPADDAQKRNVVVLGEDFWRERFNADRGVVGREVRLDGDVYTIVGVVPRSAQVIGRTDLWALASIQDAPPRSRRGHGLVAIGRLRPGVAREVGQSELEGVAAALAREFPDTNADRSVRLEPLHEAVFGTELRQTAILFIGVVGLVLLMCCANVASLLMTRATVRQREFAVRAALGADRRRIIRQLMVESLMLAAIGGGLGLVIGAGILRVAPSLMPEALLPSVVTLAIDARIAVFSAVMVVLVGLLFGIAPAWHASSLSAAQSTSGTRTATGRGGRVRELLVAGQVAVVVVLLVGAGLLLRTLLAVQGVDRGYRADQVLSMIVDPMSDVYPTDEAEMQFYRAVEREIRTVAGVKHVAWATTLPLGRSYEGTAFFEIEGQPAAAASQRPAADMQLVSPSYFEALDVAILQGRAFDERDVPGALPVCIVNEAFVRQYLPTGSAIGRRVAIRQSEAPDATVVMREIVGVARQVKASPTETEAMLQIYVPMAQDTPGDVFLLVTPRSGSAATLATPVRRAINAVDKAQLVSVRDILTLDEVAAIANARHRFRAALVMAFAGLALLLALVGLFGILAYSVQQRIRDFGVRRALGASTHHVLTLVARNTAWVIGAGAIAGLAIATMLGRFIATMLFGVEPFDPVTFVAVAVVLIAGALLSAIAPAWRAARVEPAIALRSE